LSKKHSSLTAMCVDLRCDRVTDHLRPQGCVHGVSWTLPPGSVVSAELTNSPRHAELVYRRRDAYASVPFRHRSASFATIREQKRDRQTGRSRRRPMLASRPSHLWNRQRKKNLCSPSTSLAQDEGCYGRMCALSPVDISKHPLLGPPPLPPCPVGATVCFFPEGAKDNFERKNSSFVFIYELYLVQVRNLHDTSSR
jgi:hypothetical protein